MAPKLVRVRTDFPLSNVTSARTPKLARRTLLAVKVVNQQPSSRWYSGSGIYRHTWLKTVNPVRVAYMGQQVTTPTVSDFECKLSISRLRSRMTEQRNQSVTLTSSVRDSSGTEVGKATSAATTVTAAKTAVVAQTRDRVQSQALVGCIAKHVLGGDDRIRGRRLSLIPTRPHSAFARSRSARTAALP